MQRLIPFELGKIWRKPGFLLSVLVLVVLNVFLLWYTTLSDEETPELSSYWAFQKEISGMTEEEKSDYISKLKENIDGVCFVQEILSMQAWGNEMGDSLVEQAMAEQPGVFEAYYDLYENGDYLTFTNSLSKEYIFITELYEEWQKVSGYESYLQSVQENQNRLSGISIFGEQEENTFSARNIKKSAKDYAALTAENICWMPQKAITGAMESNWTDILLLLSVFLFVGNLILEEKEKKLFYITRSTKDGIIKSMAAKIGALLIHCSVMAIFLYGVNLVFYGFTVGFGNLTADIQSLAAYMESCLSMRIWEYILYSIGTKALALFGMGTILTALCVVAESVFLPYVTGIVLWGISFLMYSCVTAASKGAVFKYLNFVGIMKTEKLYGAYLNFNLFGYPVSRQAVSWGLIFLVAVVGITLSLVFFLYGEHFERKKRKFFFPSCFRPHANLFFHESYKIMISNGAAVILLVFGILLGSRILSQEYSPSVQEQYYQNLMLQLEGELTQEKEELILAEQARYEEAFARINQIDLMAASGEISESAADSLKSEWYAVTAFYSSFERVLQQYERIEERGGNFIYDTGYLYVFGAMNDDFLIDFLLLSIGVIFAFGNVISMEDHSGSWNLLCATAKGKTKILICKIAACIGATVIFSLIPFLCRIVNVSSSYPMHGMTGLVNDIPYCQEFPVYVSIGLFLGLLALTQILSGILVTLGTLGVSYWRKNYVQAIFFAVLLFVVPLVLRLLGFSFAEWFSIYPFYSWSGRLG